MCSSGLPPRTPNAFVELVYSGETSEFHLVFFASKKIKKGHEIIADYGPDYWHLASSALLRAHASAPPPSQPTSQPGAKAKGKGKAKRADEEPRRSKKARSAR